MGQFRRGAKRSLPVPGVLGGVWGWGEAAHYMFLSWSLYSVRMSWGMSTPKLKGQSRDEVNLRGKRETEAVLLAKY